MMSGVGRAPKGPAGGVVVAVGRAGKECFPPGILAGIVAPRWQAGPVVAKGTLPVGVSGAESGLTSPQVRKWRVYSGLRRASGRTISIIFNRLAPVRCSNH